MISKIVERSFGKEKSVFKDWKSDTPEMILAMVAADLNCWKIEKFVKQGDDVANCAKVITNHATFLKDCFLSITAESSFPAFTTLDYGAWTAKCKINDNGICNQAAIDRTFISANLLKSDLVRFNPIGNSLCRYEFFEVLVRLAQLKYKDSGLAKTYAEALEMLIQENLIKHANPEPWNQFRLDELWCLEVQDVFDANIDNLKKVYQNYTNQNKRFLCMEDCTNLCMREAASLSMSEKDVKIAYAMCKMTVVNEPANYKAYNIMVFVEFLEFIGRLAYIKFKGTSESQLPLATKIEVVLDDIMFAFGMTRNDVNIAVEEFSESDDDY